MGYLIEFGLGIAGNLVAAEIIFRHKRWCQRIIWRAAHRINDPQQSAIKLEEWLAALDEHTGVIASFSHALGCWFGAPAVAAALRRPIASKTTMAAKPGNHTKVDVFSQYATWVAKNINDLGEESSKRVVKLSGLAALREHFEDAREALVEYSRRRRVSLYLLALSGACLFIGAYALRHLLTAMLVFDGIR